jgi:transcriptional regulator with XRE-family HTH domain
MKTLREWRRERLMSMRELEQASGVSLKTINELEHGRQRPQWRTIRALCTALGVTARDVAEFTAVLEQGEEAAAA